MEGLLEAGDLVLTLGHDQLGTRRADSGRPQRGLTDPAALRTVRAAGP